MASGASRWQLAWRALRHRNFQLFFSGQLISLIGTWMQSVAQSWLVYRLTGSALLLGSVGFASQIPVFLFAPLGGITADRVNRRHIVIATQVAAMILAFLLAGLTLFPKIQVWHVFVLASLLGIVNAFDIPGRQSFLVDMVGKEDLMNAIALNSSIFNGARVVGPAIAGFAIVLLGEGWCFFLNGLSFIAVLVALLMMRIEPTAKKPPDESPVRSFVLGFRFAMHDVPIRSALVMLCMLSLFGLQYSVFLPIYAHDILHGNAGTFSMLMSAAGVGAFLGALQFAARTSYTGLARWIAVTCTVCAVGLIVMSHATMFWLCATVLFVVGFAATSQMAATNTIIQERAPDELRSRLMAVYATMFMGVQPIGALLAGGVAKRIGTPNTVLLFGSIVFAGCLFFIWRVAMRVGRVPVGAAVGG